ncbi:MAG TPA: 3-oxoadipate enol-lactonase [Desulfobacteraceae bacterium]|mgnify:CR=1 FL=1|nr:3-oxoadipate enol-lactonase [Desulfobacteraceae bacterium]
MSKAIVNGININYRMEGAEVGETVMLSHSLASNIEMWDSQVPALTEKGFRVLRYDSRGHGGSDVPPGPYTMDMLADEATALLDSLGIEKVHFCGLSMGGMIGQLLGARRPERLLSLILSSTSAYMPPPHLWNERIEAVRRRGMESVADATIDRWFTGKGREQIPERVKAIKDLVLATSPEGFCACCEAIRDMDLRDVLAEITLPTLVIVGSLDPGTPVSAAEYISSRIDSSRLRVIPDAAHFVNVEHADTFNEELIGFLNR